ncbi:tRNA (cytidine(34)-2'-O)-methyltransferase [Arenibacter sp. GZD96]|uniref:tRNA (cytidine(34)-2'-O)-methyltransferase n=1 Tax=Aurantibrevibacter litoralis TaxID=3106030 RepID=UPI002AFE169C|nr:tRNA (cytidine(34)-2'-O)-methyltransferase [Arenibacter sp. GZD-96]MEA1786722.1 tRNA (cytidine(34)-2'-O)-methyltransferase [Arenibacter sp. GZD-96]
MAFNIVLVEPEIPMNTGNIGRLSLASGSHLHLVKPFGFELDDRRLKRAGLDYWPHLSLFIYENLDEFLSTHQDKEMIYFSSRAEKTHWSIDFKDEQFFVFGKESIGLTPKITTQNKENLYKIPLYSPHIRSLNLANAVAIVVYEGLRYVQRNP